MQIKVIQEPQNTNVYLKRKKVALINKVEQKYNIKVVFKTYPTNASCGAKFAKMI